MDDGIKNHHPFFVLQAFVISSNLFLKIVMLNLIQHLISRALKSQF
jgi:hypothetical protein